MKIEPTRAAAKAPQRGRWPSHWTAAALPTRTGAIAAGRVRGRAAISQILIAPPCPRRPSRSLRILGEVGLASLLVGVAALLALLGHVEEQRRVVGELLEPGDPVLFGVEARLQQAQREGGEVEHLAAPGDDLALELGQRHDRVDQAHLERLLGLVEPAEEPELLRLLDPDVADQQAGAEAAVEGADAGTGLAEAGVVGGDRHVADEVEDVAAADRVAGDHRDHRLRQPADLHVQFADVEPADALLGYLVVADVAVVAADPLVAARAEGIPAGAREDDRADLEVVAGASEGLAQLGQGLWAEGVADLGPVDRDLRDPAALLVEDVAELAGAAPLDRRVEVLFGRGFLVAQRQVFLRVSAARMRGA